MYTTRLVEYHENTRYELNNKNRTRTKRNQRMTDSSKKRNREQEGKEMWNKDVGRVIEKKTTEKHKTKKKTIVSED